MNVRNFTSVSERRAALEKELGVDLPHIGSFTVDESTAASRNCENMIGAVQVPTGVAGPLRLTNLRSGQAREYYLPLATTEGALVASINRGCKAITESGGAVAHCHRVGTTRGPVFAVSSLKENQKLYEFLESHKADISTVAQSTSHHLQFKKLQSTGVGKYRYVRFSFDTQDAMGMNMVTIATEAIARYIEEATGAHLVSLSGNFCVDKKPAWQNFINNRGMKAWAEVTIPNTILTTVLKTSAKKVFDVWLSKCMVGSAIAGSMGFNAQFANVIAALFLATGQDIAHVVEGSLGMTTCEVMEDNLYISVYLPDLMIGTVGGGTGLATQQEALSILGVAGGNDGRNAQTLAEIVAGAVLAGEISLLAALSQGTLAQAHQKLGRGK